MWTVLGASGFVGRHFVEKLRQKGEEVATPGREVSRIERGGHVLYCIGLTADFREHPLETAEAHVGKLVDFLQHSTFDSFLYLSSTRVYEGAASTQEESPLLVQPAKPTHIFNLTKLAGEACCLSQSSEKIRVARLSNVLGPDFGSQNFVFSVLDDMLEDGHVHLKTTADSAKDYIWVSDAVDAMIRIAQSGRHRIYNVASGQNLSNAEILGELSRHTRATWDSSPQAERIVFSPISVSRFSEEFGLRPPSPLSRLEELVRARRECLSRG